MKPALQLKLSQHLALTPQLQQAIRLLQLSTLELNQELEKYLLENPLLEREDEDGYAASPPADNAQESRTDTAEPRNDQDERGEPSDNSDTTDNDRSQTGSEDESWATDGNYSGSGSGAGSGNSDDDDNDYQDIQAASTSLSDHLIWQLNLTQLSDRDCMLVRVLIEALDDDGYLSQTLEELAEIMPPSSKSSRKNCRRH